MLKQIMLITHLSFLLVGCASTAPSNRTIEYFDKTTKIYKNYNYNIQLGIPKFWMVTTGDDLYRIPIVKELKRAGWECLIYGTDSEESIEKFFVLIVMPSSESIESILVKQDSTASDPFEILTKKEIKYRETYGIERIGQQKSSRIFFRERAFIYAGMAYRFCLFNIISPVSDSDAEIFNHLSLSSSDKRFSSNQTQDTPIWVDILPRSVPPLMSDQKVYMITVTGTSANIRSGAGNDFTVITTVKQGDKLALLGEHGEWFNIRLENGQEGWINKRFIKE